MSKAQLALRFGYQISVFSTKSFSSCLHNFGGLDPYDLLARAVSQLPPDILISSHPPLALAKDFVKNRLIFLLASILGK